MRDEVHKILKGTVNMLVETFIIKGKRKNTEVKYCLKYHLVG